MVEPDTYAYDEDSVIPERVQDGLEVSTPKATFPELN